MLALEPRYRRIHLALPGIAGRVVGLHVDAADDPRRPHESAASPRKVILHAPKNGFFYVIDRQTGKVLSANNFVPDVLGDARRSRDRPLLRSRRTRTTTPGRSSRSPTGSGAHNWSPMSYSPLTGLVYFRASRASMIYRDDPDFVFREGLNNTGIYRGPTTDEDRALNEANPPLSGSSLIAWDPAAGAPRFTIDGFGGGVLTTAANLLFQGRGTITGELVAFDATTGERLWSHETPNSMAPGPISYAVGGEQYIAVMGGRGFSGGNDADARARNPGRIFAFKLDGKATLPPGPGPAPPPNVPDDIFAPVVVAAGAEPYRVYCSRCHGGETHSLNIIPDLRRSAALSSAALWRSIVVDGALEPNGMIGWSQFLTPEDAETIPRLCRGAGAHAATGRTRAHVAVGAARDPAHLSARDRAARHRPCRRRSDGAVYTPDRTKIQPDQAAKSDWPVHEVGSIVTVMAQTNPPFLTGVPELLVLRMLSGREMYGYEIVKAMRLVTAEAIGFGEGVIYPVLHSLEEGGALKARRKSVNGRERVYYAVTTKGKRRLEHLSDEWKRVSLGVNSALNGNGAGGDLEHA